MAWAPRVRHVLTIPSDRRGDDAGHDVLVAGANRRLRGLEPVRAGHDSLGITDRVPLCGS